MKKIILAACIVSISFSSCSKNESKGCLFNACAYTAPAAEIQTLKDYLTTNSISAIQHCNGMFYQIEDPGTGAAAAPCSQVTVTYKGYFTNGNVFDEFTTPVSVNLQQTINGWRSGVSLLKAGGRIVLYVPPSLAYGNQSVTDGNGNIVIPANSYLIFEVDLISVS